MSDSTDDDRRRYQRFLLERPAILEISDFRHRCVLWDISLRGALLRGPGAEHARPGLEARLLIELTPDGTRHIDMQGEIVHFEGDYIGLHCTALDVDSLAQLRRLVEINSGDPALLQRELAAMVAEYSN